MDVLSRSFHILLLRVTQQIGLLLGLLSPCCNFCLLLLHVPVFLSLLILQLIVVWIVRIVGNLWILYYDINNVLSCRYFKLIVISSPGNTCNEEENYLNPYPPSTQNVPSWRQMRSSPWPPQSTTPNVSNPVPWRSPPSGKINSQDNGGNSNPSPLDHSKRGPVPLPTQKLDFRSKVMSCTCIMLSIKSIKNLKWQSHLHIQLYFHLK